MEQAVKEQEKSSTVVELITFYIGSGLYGINILNVQEINKLKDWTDVPHSEDFILGILSLRGNIVTVFDLGKKLGLNTTEVTEESRNIIVNSNNEYAGFLVDGIGDVVNIDWSDICDPPANVNGVQGRFLEGVFKTKEGLITILDVDEVLSDNKDNSQS